MKKILLSLSVLIGFASQSQMVVNPYLFSSAPPPACPFAVNFYDLNNVSESPTGTWVTVTTDGDSWATADVAIPASTEGSFQCDYLAASNTTNFAISWDVSNSLTGPFYSAARYVFFVYGEEYWYNDNQAGAISTVITPVDGDKFRLYRKDTVISSTPTQVIWAQINRTGSWVNVYRYSGTQTAQLYMQISSANNGEDNLRMLNPKHCGGEGFL